MIDIEKEVQKKIERKKEISKQLMNEKTFKDRIAMTSLQRELREINEILNNYNEYNVLKKRIEEDESILEEDDDELVEIAKEEIKGLKVRIEEVERKIIKSLLVKEKEDENNAIIEIRQGTGGEEASLFAKDLFRMYTKYVEKKGWKYEVLSSHPTDLGGFKEIVFLVKGENAYGTLRFESGVHRVQRIPVTESGGRIHTSAASVAVLPELEEFELSIDEKDIKMEFYNASGPGGQNVNKVATAVRLIHIPTGLVVTCQDERSQFQNRVRAMSILRSKLYQIEKEKREKEVGMKRRNQIGSGDRSEKIRTYNFPQNRLTDHRINFTSYNLESFLEGELDELIDNLQFYFRSSDED